MPNLAPKNLCTGCTACASPCPVSAITMRADEYGFLVPVVNEEMCIGCGLCESICPINNSVETLEPGLSCVASSDAAAPTKAYGAISHDEEARAESSSGGVFSLLAEMAIDEGGVVFGAAFDDNFVVKHIEISNKEELALLRGSKYSQSEIGDTYKKVLARIREGKKVLFTGSPCQVGGLRAFLSGVATPYDRVDELLLCMDFVCHSVPSPLAFEEYKSYRFKTDAPSSKITNVTFRSKANGWSDYKYSTAYTYENGNKYLCVGRKDPYMRLFLGGYICRESCYDCQFKGYERCSDITLADFWGVWDTSPELDDNKGTSLILIHSKAGAKALSTIKDKMTLKKISLEEGSRINNGMLNCAKASPDRDRALTYISEGNFEAAVALLPVINEYKPSLKTKAKIKLKKIIKK